MLFKPFNWYTAGLTSPVEYYEHAIKYEHKFRIVISNTVHYDNKYKITGKCLYNNKQTLNDFETKITKNFNGISAEHEGDFTIIHDGIVYRIDTTIESNNDYDINKYKFNKDPVNTIDLDIPKDVIKMAMIVLHLEI
jgi:hypothetical protein